MNAICQFPVLNRMDRRRMHWGGIHLRQRKIPMTTLILILHVCLRILMSLLKERRTQFEKVKTLYTRFRAREEQMESMENIVVKHLK